MKIKIVATTDIHGRVFPTHYTSRKDLAPFGMARFSSYLNMARQHDDIILVDNGDSYQGTPLTAYAHNHAQSYSNPMAYAFNRLDYDFLNLGNHDFNYGPSILKKFMREIKAPLLTSNIEIDGTIAGSTHIVERDGKKIAFIGVLTHFIPNWERSSYIENMVFHDAYQSMKREVESIRDRVDFVVGLYHGGLERDPKTGEPTERLTGENQGYEMAHIKGLDVLITGHQHRSFVETIDNTLVTQTTFNAHEFAVIELDLTTKNVSASIQKTSEYPVDTAFLEPLNQLQERVQDWLDQAVGSIDDHSPSLEIQCEFDARLNKHPLVSFINQVQLWKSKADISAVALFNGARGFGKTITMRELVSTYIFPNTLVVKKMSVKTIKEMIETSCLYYVFEDEKVSVNPRFINPKPQHYNYDMLDGIDYTVDISRPKYHRVVSVERQGRVLEDHEEFTVVMNNYRASGGGNFPMIPPCETVLEIQEEMLDIMVEYFQVHQPVHVCHQSNITIHP